MGFDIQANAPALLQGVVQRGDGGWTQIAHLHGADTIDGAVRSPALKSRTTPQCPMASLRLRSDQFQ